MHPYLRLSLVCLCASMVFCGCASTGRVLNVGVASAKFLDWHSTNVAEAAGGVEGNALVGTGDLRQAVVGVLGEGIRALVNDISRTQDDQR